MAVSGEGKWGGPTPSPAPPGPGFLLTRPLHPQGLGQKQPPQHRASMPFNPQAPSLRLPPLRAEPQPYGTSVDAAGETFASKQMGRCWQNMEGTGVEKVRPPLFLKG